jgi:hypothetical protein
VYGRCLFVSNGASLRHRFSPPTTNTAHPEDFIKQFGSTDTGKGGQVQFGLVLVSAKSEVMRSINPKIYI